MHGRVGGRAACPGIGSGPRLQGGEKPSHRRWWKEGGERDWGDLGSRRVYQPSRQEGAPVKL